MCLYIIGKHWGSFLSHCISHSKLQYFALHQSDQSLIRCLAALMDWLLTTRTPLGLQHLSCKLASKNKFVYIFGIWTLSLLHISILYKQPFSALTTWAIFGKVWLENQSNRFNWGLCKVSNFSHLFLSLYHAATIQFLCFDRAFQSPFTTALFQYTQWLFLCFILLYIHMMHASLQFPCVLIQHFLTLQLASSIFSSHPPLLTTSPLSNIFFP